jgi:hypothetical protein
MALRAGRFDADGWVARQVTTGRTIRLQGPDGRSSHVRALGVDPDGGGLIVDGLTADGGPRTILTGEIVHLRLMDGSAADGSAVDGRPVVESVRV